MKILMLNGPNLGRLGLRDPAVYGSETLADVVARVEKVVTDDGHVLHHRQSNHEGDLLDFLHAHQDDASAIIINPAGLTAVGHSLRDGIADAGLPTVVVHISNPAARPAPWAREDIFAPQATAVVAGAGTLGYVWAAQLLCQQLA